MALMAVFFHEPLELFTDGGKIVLCDHAIDDDSSKSASENLP